MLALNLNIKESNSRTNKVLVLVILLLVILCYSSVFGLEILRFWDDQWVVQNDYTSAGFTWKNISNILSEFYHGQYSPVNQLYYTFLYTLFGYNALFFHMGSLLFHLLNTVLVFKIVSKVCCE